MTETQLEKWYNFKEWLWCCLWSHFGLWGLKLNIFKFGSSSWCRICREGRYTKPWGEIELKPKAYL